MKKRISNLAIFLSLGLLLSSCSQEEEIGIDETNRL